MFGTLMNWMKAQRLLPQISDTERQALEAGSVWIDGQLFSGRLDFGRILSESYGSLSPEEQAFLDGPVEELLDMIDPYRIGQSKRIPDEVIDFVKQKGFMSFLIPKAYGGLEFSTLAISTIMAKIGAVNSAVGTLVVIPNSLGAAELIIHYGTDEQKSHYLPRLARGEYVPCFGLTEPTAGSDAASIKADGEVFRDDDGQIKIRLNFRKRYITLAPIADLATIACRLNDPENLLDKGTTRDRPDLGITCVMVHKGTPGFVSGDHHDPIGDPFYNGPLEGRDVVVPADNIIGGPAYAGQGWRMLMEQLAGGRMVSLPAGAVGGAKAVAAVTGAYSMVRQQFGIPIGRMEGVEEKIGRIAALAYMMEGARVFGCTAVDSGHQPPVVSAVMKAYTTELARQLVTDAMDVFAGSGVMQGPNNILGMGYKSAPVGVTVEGANIMTRTLMIFGQGATRCHPFALDVVKAVESDNVEGFRGSLLGWIGHFFKGLARAELNFLTRGRWTRVSAVAPELRPYARRLGWATARYGVVTDLAMFAIGGRLKLRGKLTGRFADALAWQLLALGALRRYEAEGRRAEDLPLAQYACEYCLAQVQAAFEGIYANFDGPVGLWLKTVGLLELRINPLGRGPDDALSGRAARTIQQYDEQYLRLCAGVYQSKDESVGSGRLMKAFRLLSQSAPTAQRLQHAQRTGKLARGLDLAETARQAVAAGIIEPAEADALVAAEAARSAAIEVDAFAPEHYFGVVREAVPPEYKTAVGQ